IVFQLSAPDCDPCRRIGWRNRREPGEPRPFVLRECPYGDPGDRGLPALRRGEDDGPGNYMLVSEIYTCSLSRSGFVAGISGRNQCAVWNRKKGAARAVPGLPATVQPELRFPFDGEPLWASG